MLRIKSKCAAANITKIIYIKIFVFDSLQKFAVRKVVIQIRVSYSSKL